MCVHPATRGEARACGRAGWCLWPCTAQQQDHLGLGHLPACRRARTQALRDQAMCHPGPCQVHASLKTVADYESYLAEAIPSLPQDAIKVPARLLAWSPADWLIPCWLAACFHGPVSGGILGPAPAAASPAFCLQRAAPQLLDSPISNGGTIVRCSKLNRLVCAVGATRLVVRRGCTAMSGWCLPDGHHKPMLVQPAVIAA